MSGSACSVTPVTNDQSTPSPANGPRPGPRDPLGVSEQARALDATLEAALARLDGLDATAVHDHVEVFTAVDHALRQRLAGAEG